MIYHFVVFAVYKPLIREAHPIIDMVRSDMFFLKRLWMHQTEIILLQTRYILLYLIRIFFFHWLKLPNLSITRTYWLWQSVHSHSFFQAWFWKRVSLIISLLYRVLENGPTREYKLLIINLFDPLAMEPTLEHLSLYQNTFFLVLKLIKQATIDRFLFI